MGGFGFGLTINAETKMTTDSRLLPWPVLTCFLLSACTEIQTSDPVEAYTHWAGARPTEDLKIVKGTYWESAHWSKEYILYLKVLPTDGWWSEFVSQNKLRKDNGQWAIPAGAPQWFKIPDDVTIYAGENDLFGSRYLRDNRTGECYIYDIQL